MRFSEFLQQDRYTLLIESIGHFNIHELDPEQVEKLYQTFKSSYEASTGMAWNKEFFLKRAANWNFVGSTEEPAGFVSIRNQGPINKLVGAAGSPIVVARAAQEIAKSHYPTWGMMTDKLANFMKKLGFVEPSPILIKTLSSYVPQLGKAINSIGDDGAMSVNLSGGLGTASKRLIGNKPYFRWMLNQPMMQNVPDATIKEIEALGV